MALVPGNTVHIPDTGPPHARGRPHMFVVLTEPCAKGMILMAPICTIRSKHDATCKIGKGEHDFVQQESYVAYFDARQYKAEALDDQISKSIIRTDKDVTPALLKRICDGVSASRHTPPTERKYYEGRLAEAANAAKKS